ncbi:MAG: filamentous hemagglutinin N-terminal domain-containing protein, partial [Candidatus Kerfeldbacteria bacterium]|nr:filamentous hemagglutinin N-terminal domain-containing protein [Candidatus Kerfeldbacteria bacterium]
AVFTQAPDSAIKTGGSLKINPGVTLNAANTLYEISKDWINLGRFNPQSSKVALISPEEARVIGSNIFYDFSITVPGKIVRFDSESTQAIIGTLTLKGEYGKLLALQSLDPPKQWKINPQGQTDIQYTLISDSVNIRGPPLKALYSSSAGNLNHWDLDPYWTGQGPTANWSDPDNWDTDRYWVGGAGTWDASTTTNWSATSGGAGGASVPGATDNVYFDSSSGTGTATVAAAVNIAGFSFAAANITINLNANTFTATSFSQSAGTFSGSTNSITISGNFTLSAGTFTSTSGTLSVGGDWSHTGGKFTHNSGTVDFTKASGTQAVGFGADAFYNLTHSGAGTLQLVDNLSLSNGATLTNSAGTLTLWDGSIILPLDTANAGSSIKLEFPSPGTLNIHLEDTANWSFYKFDIPKDKTVNIIPPNISWAFLDGSGFIPASELKPIQQNPVNPDSYGNYPTLKITVTGPDTTKIDGRLVFPGRVIIENPNGIDIGPGAQIEIPSLILSTLEILTANFVNQRYDFARLGNSPAGFIYNQGRIKGDNIVILANAVNNSGVIEASGAITIVSGDRARVSYDNLGFPEVKIDAYTRAAPVDFGGEPVISAITNSGRLSSAQVNVDAEISPGIFTNGVNHFGVIKATAAANANRPLIRVFSNENIRISGSLDAYSARAGPFARDGPSQIGVDNIDIASQNSIAVAQNLRTNGSARFSAGKDIFVLAALTVDSGDLNLLADADLDGVGAFKQAQGTFITAKDITIQSSGESTLANINASGDLILKQAGAAAVFTQAPDSAIKTGGSLKINPGVTLNAANTLYEISKNWINLGNFNPQSSKVALISPEEARVIGSNIFYDFSVTVPGKIVRFDSENTQAIIGTLTLKGEYGKLLVLQSLDPPKLWKINPQGQTDIQYTLVSDSVNIRGPPLKAEHSSSAGNLANFDLDLYWTGLGPTSFWSDPNNWDTGTLPTQFDTVTFNGLPYTVTIDRDVTVTNFIATTPGTTFIFKPGTLTTILGLFKIQGAYGEGHIKLLSQTDGEQWFINPKGPRDLSYVWVKDSYNLDPVEMAMTFSTNRGNNYNWDANITWNGGTGAWATNANWVGGTAPGTGDVAVFDSTSTVNCSIGANVSVAGISINSGYTGTITQTSTYTITIGSSGFSQAAGTFTGGSGAITDSGNFTLSSGAFTSTSGTLSVAGDWSHTGGTFTHNSGTVDFTKASGTQAVGFGPDAFYNLTHS